MKLEGFENGERPAVIRQRFNRAVNELRQVRRQWSVPFDGDHCTHNGRDYDYVLGNRDEEPGTGDAWREKQYIVPGQDTPAAALIARRGSYAELQAMPANTDVDVFIVEGDDVQTDNDSRDGRYWKTASGGRYIWAREAA